jgi:hypothetical protein
MHVQDCESLSIQHTRASSKGGKRPRRVALIMLDDGDGDEDDDDDDDDLEMLYANIRERRRRRKRKRFLSH